MQAIVGVVRDLREGQCDDGISSQELLDQRLRGPRGPSDRDTLAEKAMVAYLLTYASKDYEVVAQYTYKMAVAMIAERKKPNA